MNRLTIRDPTSLTFNYSSILLVSITLGQFNNCSNNACLAGIINFYSQCPNPS